MNELQIYQYDNPELLQTGKEMLRALIKQGDIADFSQIPVNVKVAILQNIPPKLIKRRPLTSTVSFPYIPHETCRKFLNFIFNYQIDSELISEQFETTDLKGGKKFYECEVTMKFTCYNHTLNKKISRTVSGSIKQWQNPAISKFAAKQGAISIAWRNLLKDFGIGHNLDKLEEKAYNDMRQCEEQEKQSKNTTYKNKKSF